MVAAIKVICTRPMMMHGQRIETGTVLALDPHEAAAAVASGRANLQDPADRVLASCGRIPGELLRFGRAA